MDHCAFHNCGGAALESDTLAAPDTFDNSTPWKFYNHLIAQIPEGIRVTDYCLGQDWCYVDADCGMGMSHVIPGGGAPTFGGDPRDFELHELAQLVKSWRFTEASIGVAAINAWYSQLDKLDALGAFFDGEHTGHDNLGDPFNADAIPYAGKKVAMVGHFPAVSRMREICELTVLERSCNSPDDVPDPACEYVIPSQDMLYLTGTTIINKTAPRLLDLARDAYVVMVGPSTVPSPFLFKWGVDVLGGSVVVDRENAKMAIKGGSKDVFRAGIKKFLLKAE